MAAIGLVLLVLSGIFTLGVVLSNTDPVSASAFGVTLSNVSLGGLFLAGAIAGILFGIGLGLLVAGSARKRHRRVATKRTIKGTRTEKEQLAAENEELRARLAAERSTGTNGVATRRTSQSGQLDDGRMDGGSESTRTHADGAVDDPYPIQQEQGRRGVFGRR